MATTQTAKTEKSTTTPTVGDLAIKRSKKRKARRAGNKARDLKLRSDKEFAKTFFEARSKRSTEKKQAFRKKKSKKK